MNTRTITINTDGGSRGNPGPAACAFVVKEIGAVIYEESKFMGISTNNQAEYMAMLRAMEWLSKNNKNVKSCIFILDSELVAKQLQGKYKIKDEKLKPYAISIKDLERNLGVAVTYTIVKREFNKEADLLVNKSLDENVPISRCPGRKKSE